MQHARLAARLYGTPHLITPEKAGVIEAAFREFNAHGPLVAPKVEREPATDLASAFGATRTAAGYSRTNDGVAIIQVVGPLLQRGNSLDAMCGFESYQNIGAQIDAANADPLTRGVLLEIDSPGGEAAGVFDLGARIAALATKKPVVAHANEAAFSAAYAIASAAGELYMPQTGMVGSVGVILMHVDQSGYDAKRGVVYTPITAGAQKADFSSHAPLSSEAEARAQAMVDDLYNVFVAHVAAGRGIDEQAVRDTEAGLLNPEQAMAIGMADGVATLDGALARVRELMNSAGGRPPAYSRNAAITKGTSMSITQADLDAAVAKARAEEQAKAKEASDAAVKTAAAEAEAKAKTEAKAEAEKAEMAAKTRVSAILGHAEAKGREDLAKHLAFDTDMTAEAAAAVLKASPKGSSLAARMAGTNPNVGNDGDPPKPAEASSVISFREAQMAFAANEKKHARG
jgi:signal peptide peptidase SppA